jgi:hypothetical protein
MIREATTDGRIAEFKEALEAARARGDAGMERAMKVELATLGVFETVTPEPLEMAVPAKPGRRRMPRCEHDTIIPRCPLCYPEEQI